MDVSGTLKDTANDSRRKPPYGKERRKMQKERRKSITEEHKKLREYLGKKEYALFARRRRREIREQYRGFLVKNGLLDLFDDPDEAMTQERLNKLWESVLAYSKGTDDRTRAKADKLRRVIRQAYDMRKELLFEEKLMKKFSK